MSHISKSAASIRKQTVKIFQGSRKIVPVWLLACPISGKVTRYTFTPLTAWPGISIVVGYLRVMMLCAFPSRELLTTLPSVEPVLRIFGVCYLLWLTAGTARATYAFDQGDKKPMAFM
jgi:hypothetical protein